MKQASQQAALGQRAVSNFLLQSGSSLQSGETHRMKEALVPVVPEHQTLGRAVDPRHVSEPQPLGAQAELPHVQDGATAGRARCEDNMIQRAPVRLALRRRSLALQQHAGCRVNRVFIYPYLEIQCPGEGSQHAHRVGTSTLTSSIT